MLIAIIIYILILIGVGVFDAFKVKNFEDYAVAGKRQSFIFVFLSLMATMIGASATIGMTDRVVQIGFPAFWWLGVGTIGLILQSVLLSEKIRALDANTLPDVAMKTVGKGGKTLLALIIAVSWVGIIAAQIVSIVKIMSFVVTGVNQRNLVIVISIIVILYTLVGGQLSVIKTDAIQSWLIAIGVLATFIYLFTCKGQNNAEILSNVHLLNKDFNMLDWMNLFFITGGAYFLGPDIISRNLVSKDGKTAKKAAFVSGVCLFFFSAVITLTGMWVVSNVGDIGGQNPLLYIIHNVVPAPIAVILCLALISTLLSSADTCLINAASIVEYDLLKRDKVNEIRVIVGILGVASLLIALFKSNIIGLLTGAYSIYTPGIVFPLFMAIWFHGKRKVWKPAWYAAVIIGGGMGILNTYLSIGSEYFPLIGMGISLGLSIVSVLPIYEKNS